MKKLFFVLAVTGFMAACNNESATEAPAADTTTAAPAEAAPAVDTTAAAADTTAK